MGPLAGFSGLSRDKLALAGLPHVSAAGRCGSAGRAVLLLPSRLALWWSHSGCAGFQESRTRPSPLRPLFGTSTLSFPPYPIGHSKPQSQARFKQGKQTPPLHGAPVRPHCSVCTLSAEGRTVATSAVCQGQMKQLQAVPSKNLQSSVRECVTSAQITRMYVRRS